MEAGDKQTGEWGWLVLGHGGLVPGAGIVETIVYVY